jgi:hypothetical protein
MVIAVAIHVGHESVTGFLDFYNPAVLQLRERLPFLPAPIYIAALLWTELWLRGPSAHGVSAADCAIIRV